MEQLIWETAEELDQKLARRVRNIRKRRSISQEKLAQMSGVSYDLTYSNTYYGEHTTSVPAYLKTV